MLNVLITTVYTIELYFRNTGRMKPVYCVMLLQKFSYRADELRSFILSVDTFILTLNNGRVVQYCPPSIAVFRRWLLDNNIRDSKMHLKLTELFR